MSGAPVLLVVATAPVRGMVRTRLAADVGDDAAADLAAASLLDPLTTVRATGWPAVVALTGDLAAAARRAAVRAALLRCVVLPQRRTTFGERLASTHRDAARVRRRALGVLRIGMDTPQVSVEHLAAAQRLLGAHGSVLGATTDGGLWMLGLRDDDAAADCSMNVPMSGAPTCAATDAVLQPVYASRLTDVDVAQDALQVAAAAPDLLFATAWRSSPVASR
jgi:hypothetical protein